jgi:hypothetical protein
MSMQNTIWITWQDCRVHGIATDDQYISEDNIKLARQLAADADIPEKEAELRLTTAGGDEIEIVGLLSEIDRPRLMYLPRRQFPLPEPLGDMRYFVWGPVVKLHKISGLSCDIIEYKPRIHDSDGLALDRFSTDHMFHLHGTGCSYDTLAAAIIFAIARFNRVDDDHYARAAVKLLT